MARKPPTKTAERESAVAPARQEVVDLHLTFGERLLSEKQAAAITPRGVAGQANSAAGGQATKTTETYAAPSFRRGRIWA